MLELDHNRLACCIDSLPSTQLSKLFFREARGRRLHERASRLSIKEKS